MLAPYVERIRENTVKRLCNHGEVGSVLKDLKSGWLHIEGILEEKVNSHPWETSQSLHQKTHSKHNLLDQLAAAASILYYHLSTN